MLMALNTLLNCSEAPHVHVDRPEHAVSMDKVKILTLDNRKFERGVKEAIYIRVMEPSLNKDGGCYLLPAVWTNLLKAMVWEHPSPRTDVEVDAPHVVPQHHHGANSTGERPQQRFKDLSSKSKIIL